MFVRAWIAVTITALCICTSAELVSRVCLGCICEVSTGCNANIGCSGSICGPFSISWEYWDDAGKPTLNNEAPNTNSYANCVNDPYCAALTVENYMVEFNRDCNGNGITDCEDFMRIHQYGANRCTRALKSKLENHLKLCLQTYQNQ